MLRIKRIYNKFYFRAAAFIGTIGLAVCVAIPAAIGLSDAPNTGFTISGRTITTSGFHIAGTAIGLSGDADGFLLTDSNGAFSFPNLPVGGTFLVTASKIDFEFEPESYEILNLQNNVSITFIGTCLAMVCPTASPTSTPTNTPTALTTPTPADVVSTWNGTTGNWSDASKWSSNPQFPNNGNGGFTYDAVIPGGDTTLDQAIVIQKFTLSAGTLTNPGSFLLTLNDLFTWSGGSIFDAGTLDANGGMSLIGSADKTVRSRTINNPGAATWTGGQILSGQGAVFNNTGIFTTNSEGNFRFTEGGATPQFNNSGTFTKSGGGDTTFGVSFNNSGTVNADSGRILLASDASGDTSTSTGSFIANSGGTIKFGGGSTYDLNAGSSVSGNGTIEIGFGGSGTLNLNAGSNYNVAGTTSISGGTANFNIPAATNALTISGGGVVGGSGGTFTVSGLFTWSGGYIVDAGTFDANGGMSLIGSADKTVRSRTINNPGAATWTGGQILSGQGAVFNNTGIFTTNSEGNFRFTEGGATPQFNNSGTFTKSGSGETTISVPFNNTGTVNANSGTINFAGGYNQTGGMLVLNGNNVSAPGAINLNGGQVVGIGIVNGGLNNNSSTTAPGFSGAVNSLLNDKGYRAFGSSIGSITVTGTLTYNSGSTYECEIDSTAATADKTIANGVSITSATISLTDLGNGKPLGSVFTVIDNTSGSAIGGTFSNLADDSWIIINGNTYYVTYSGGTGNDLTLTFAAVAGTVTYGNTASGPPPPRFVSNVTITAAGSPNVSTVTGAPGPNAGTYLLTGFLGGSYTFTPTKTGGVNNITSFDAARIAQHVAGTSLLTGNQLIVADTSNNGMITSFDAAQIARFVVNLPPFGVTGTWRFIPVSNTHNNIAVSITGEDYTALLMGEVSGNWANTGARPAIVRGPEKPTMIDAPHLVTPADDEVLIPVSVERAVNKGIISYEFDLRFDPSVIQPQRDPVDLGKTVSHGLSFAVNADEVGLLRVAVYGPMPIDGDGVLLNLKFSAVGAPGSVSPLTWERFMFNEGGALTTAADGQVELSEAAPDKAEISGRVLTAFRAGVPNSRVTLTDTTGQSRSIFSNGFGVYRFGGLQVGQTYTISVESRRWTFTPLTVSVTDHLVVVDMIAEQ